MAQSDGSVLIGGYFTLFKGMAWNSVARLHPKGSLDNAFNPGSGADAVVYAVAPQTDGNVLIGGEFTNFNDPALGAIARLLGGGGMSAPQLLHPTWGSGGFRISVDTSTGKSCLLQFKNSLADSLWTGLASVAGNVTVQKLSDPSATALRRCYRVAVQ